MEKVTVDWGNVEDKNSGSLAGLGGWLEPSVSIASLLFISE